MTSETKNILLAALGIGLVGGLFYLWKSGQDEKKKGASAQLPAGQTLQNSFLGNKVLAQDASVPNFAANAFASNSVADASVPNSVADASNLFSDASNKSQDSLPKNTPIAHAEARMMRRGAAFIDPVVNIPRVGQGGIDDRNIAANAKDAYLLIARLIELSYSDMSTVARNSPSQPKQLSAYTGVFTNELKAAIAHYQIAHNMPGTGIPDKDTMDNLNDYSASLTTRTSGKYPQLVTVIV